MRLFSINRRDFLGKIKNNKNRRKEPNDMVNGDIRFDEVLVIDETLSS